MVSNFVFEVKEAIVTSFPKPRRQSESKIVKIAANCFLRYIVYSVTRNYLQFFYFTIYATLRVIH